MWLSCHFFPYCSGLQSVSSLNTAKSIFSSLLLPHSSLKEIFCYLATTSHLSLLKNSEVSSSGRLQLSFLNVLPNETLTLTVTSERRGEIQNKEGYFQFTGNLNHKKKNIHPKEYIIARNYCQSNSAHNNQRTAKPEKPLHMQLFKKKSESVSFRKMTTQNSNVVRLPQSYSYFEIRKGWKCTQKSSMFIETTESDHPLTGKRLCHFPHLYSLVL